MIITKNNIQSLVENWTLEVLSEEDSPMQKLDEVWPFKSKSKKEEPGSEEEGAGRYPFMKDFLKTGDVSSLKKNKQEVFNLVAELVGGIDMSLSDMAEIEKRNKEEQEERERAQKSGPGQSGPGQSSPGRSSPDPEPKLGDALNDKGEEAKPPPIPPSKAACP